jgi:hypothetical protein
MIPINNPQDNANICDLSFRASCDGSRFDNIYFVMISTPASKDIFFEGTVAIFDAKMTEKLHEAKIATTKYPKSKEIDSGSLHLMSFSKLTNSKERYLAENGILNVRYEVTPNFTNFKLFKVSDLYLFADQNLIRCHRLFKFR